MGVVKLIMFVKKRENRKTELPVFFLLPLGEGWDGVARIFEYLPFNYYLPTTSSEEHLFFPLQ